jgi:hypothetical protein
MNTKLFSSDADSSDVAIYGVLAERDDSETYWWLLMRYSLVDFRSRVT